MGDGFEGLRQGHTTHGCAIIEQRGEVEPNPLWHRVLSFVMVGREFYSISPLLRNAGRIVEALEGLAPEGVAKPVERLAHHALRGEVWDKAAIYCQQAGARAWDRAALHEAVVAFEQA